MIIVRADKEIKALMKSFGGKKNFSNLHKVPITDKNGHTRMVWVKNNENKPGMKPAKKVETQEKKEPKTYWIQDFMGNRITNIEAKNRIKRVEENMKRVDATAEGGDKATKVYAEASKRRLQNYKEDLISKLTPEDRKEFITPKASKQLMPTYGRKQIPASKFKAAEYKQVYDDETINADSQQGMDNAIKAILELPIVKKHPEFEMKFKDDLNKAMKEPETVTKYRQSGEGVNSVYTPERKALHDKIIKGLLSPELIKKASPKDGEQPTFQILGGRGGSGKSTFNKKKSDAGVYNSDNVVVVDPDALKELLAEESGEGWKGYKARAYHEESSDLSKKLMKAAMALGLNIVMDITMSSADKQIDELKLAKNLGYKTGAYYMHVPKQESLKRAIKRYIQNPNDDKIEDFSGRFVPPDVLLNMTGNEANFDKVKDFADDWSFYDNFIPFEKDEKTGKNKYTAEKIAKKGEE